MVRAVFGPLLLTTALVAAGPVPQVRLPHEQSRFRSGVELVSVTATVRDAEGRLVADLPRDLFDVYEDGELQTVTQFTHERVPLSLTLALDVSDSMYGRRIEDARTAVERFLFELLDPADEFLILAFSHRPRVLTRWTRSKAVVRPALEGLQPFGGTAIYDAVITALPLMRDRSHARAALLLISDGADSASDASLGDVRSAMLRSNAFTYAIAIDSPGAKSINAEVNPGALRDITDGSGGRTEVVEGTADLIAATSRIAEELNNQYVLGYYSSHGSDGRYHSIRVRIRDGDYRVRARTGYVAESRPRLGDP